MTHDTKYKPYVICPHCGNVRYDTWELHLDEEAEKIRTVGEAINYINTHGK